MARRDRGAAAVEMAIVLPMLLLVIGGLVDFGRAFYLQAVITNASREGARMIAMGYSPGAANARATTAFGGSLGSLSPTLSPGSCPNAGGASYTITIPNGAGNTQFHWLVLNVIPSFFGGSIPAPALTATGNMRCGG
ncbi:TadE family protein [Phycicoccus sp. SLBN-51]|uniref:TadE/TadG family type IV pilus assembly protein n=1 Tax=Phycicoccus sp. SLBN-51 TaxID=2768447 RepID=UPI0011710265|nr:TadE family protein [Phycicoccus sp. SLBN-51]TQJ51679.1 TadE-like protein [Phycicoccus sp. SLBN-51]